MNRTVIYLRVSSKAQEDNTSLESQEAYCRAYCAEHGLLIVDVLRDVATGADMDRPGLTEALDHLRKDRADVLLVHAIDRLTRDQKHLGVIQYEVEDMRGGRVLSVTEPIVDTAESRLSRSVAGYVGEIERGKILERTVRGRRQRSLRGSLPGSVALYGYEWTEDHTTYQIDPETALIVERIFTQAAAGYPLYRIANELTLDGIPTPSQRHARRGAGGERYTSDKWAPSSIRRMLHNPTYKGQPLAFRHHIVTERRKDKDTNLMRKVKRFTNAPDPIALPENTVPPIVSAEVWAKAQEALTRNKAEAMRSSKITSDEGQLLRAGFAFCAYCGAKMFARSNRGGRVLYRCGAHANDKRIAQRFCPGNEPSITCATLDADIWAKVLIALNTDAVALALLNRAGGSADDESGAVASLRSQVAAFDGNIEQLAKRRKVLRRQQETAYDDAEYEELDGRIQQMTQRMRELTEERQELQERIDALSGSQMDMAGLVERVLSGRSRIAVRLPANGPRPDEPGFAAWLADALARLEEKQRGAAVTKVGSDLTISEKRALLRWLGVRVEVYRRGDKQADGTYWTMRLDTPTGAGQFPLDGTELESTSSPR